MQNPSGASVPNPISVLQQLDGLNRIYTVNKYDYLMLFKRVKDKPYYTLYITDALDNYWIERYDLEYFEKTATRMNLQGDIKALVGYISEALRTESSLVFAEEGPEITLRIRIGEAVNINHVMNLTIKVGRDNRPEEFRKLNRTFMMQMFEAKDKEASRNSKKFEEFKNQVENKSQKEKKIDQAVHQKYIQAVLLKPQQRKVVKKGDLINPNMKKRKHEGVKFDSDAIHKSG